jgi:class 3 adenylate cyclase/tetratricopeptide (TPR) repeat protein
MRVTTVRCALCGLDNKTGRKFCGGCGAALARTCEACGYVNEAADRYCGGCGQPVGDREVAAPKPHVPGDRRPVVVMFCDLVGYTRLASKLDPEEVHVLLERFFDVVDAAVVRYGGVIDKHIGDAVMALFGAPLAHGDDAMRAVRAALEIQDAVAGIPSATPHPLAVHVGLALGEVVASSVGSDRHRGYTVTGEAANIAARLLDRAGAGETFVSDEVHRATLHAADYESLGLESLKGLENPVQVWRLRGLKLLAPGTGAPLVGRRAELAQCRAALAAIGEGHSGAVVAVRGEPGIGKTRFLEEMQSVADGFGFERHSGWVLDFGTERGHGAVRTIVGSLLGLARDAPPGDVEAAIGTRSGDDRLYLRDLLEVPQREEDRPLYEVIDRAARGRAKERVVADLIEEQARKRPLLLTVEDIHWADPDTLSLLQAFARATRASRTALIMTTRIGADPLDAAWRASAGEGLHLTIDLGPLAVAEAQGMAQNFPAAEAFTAKCVERAGGNPLFLEQLLRTAGGLVDDRLPTTIQSVVLARTDLLAPNDRRAIEAASVLGQRFALANLQALIQDPAYACDSLLRNALLRPIAEGMQFVHALVRDGVYASLTRARRRQLHRQAADIFPDDPVLRAEHLDLAEDPEAARTYLAASKDQAALFRLDQAAALAARGLKLATEARDRMALALQLGARRLDAGRGEDALEAFKTALQASGGPQDGLPALIGCAAANRLLGKLDDASAALIEAEPAAKAVSDDHALAEIYSLRGNLSFAKGKIEECRNAHAAALDVALRLASPEWRARALSGLGDIQYLDCRMATALAHFSECVELCDAAGLTRVALPNRVMMGHCRIYVCEFDAGLGDMGLALEAARRIGAQHAEMFAIQSTGLCLTAAGRYGEAAPIQPVALDLARRLKARRYQAVIFAICAELALAAGRIDEARSLLREGLAASEETSPGFAGPILLGLSALAEPAPEAQEEAISAGEALLAKGAVGHNHFGFRRYAIEHALRARDWDAAERHAEALLLRMAPEPLPYATFVARRGQLLARIGRGAAGESEAVELRELRASAAATGLRMDAWDEGLANGWANQPGK